MASPLTRMVALSGIKTPEPSSANLIASLIAVAGKRHVAVGDAAAAFSSGYRFGGGSCLAAVSPGTLLEQWHVIRLCVEADAVVIMQAANTGLTGGSTPDGADYDGREVIVVNTLRLDDIQVIAGGTQVVCLPGSTLYGLERILKPYGREPHSVIGSSCIGASVIGGVCNNSGGALVRRGPAYTELAIYARVGRDRRIELVNEIGIDLGSDPETILTNLQDRAYKEADINHDTNRRASDASYAGEVRRIDASTPARFNADPSRLSAASGSAGRIAVFAVRLDTFVPEADTKVFYIGTNDPAELTELRRVILRDAPVLPIAGEYIHRNAFDIAARYGKDTFAAIKKLGTDRLPKLFRWKDRLDRIASRIPLLGAGTSDRWMQRFSNFIPQQLPTRILDFHQRYEHHLILKTGGAGTAHARAYLASAFPSKDGDAFECLPEEAEAAFLHRFVTAGAAVRYRAVHRDAGELIALDVALRRDDRNWLEELPQAIAEQIELKLYYGHFFCHVFHQDYVLKKGADPLAVEHAMWAILDRRGAEYPAEHNVGHLYPAKPALAEFYQKLDPCNVFNPGIGKTTKMKDWRVRDDAEACLYDGGASAPSQKL